MNKGNKPLVLRLAPQNAPNCETCDLVVESVDFFRGYFQREMEKVPEGEVVLDLRRVSQIDSVGISLVVSLFKECETLGRPFSVETEGEEVFRMFQMLNLDDVFPVRDFSF